MEPEGSLPRSQEPVTGHCPEPGKSSPHPPTLIPEDPFLLVNDSSLFLKSVITFTLHQIL